MQKEGAVHPLIHNHPPLPLTLPLVVCPPPESFWPPLLVFWADAKDVPSSKVTTVSTTNFLKIASCNPVWLRKPFHKRSFPAQCCIARARTAQMMADGIANASHCGKARGKRSARRNLLRSTKPKIAIQLARPVR